MSRSIPLTLPSGRTIYAEVEDTAAPEAAPGAAPVRTDMAAGARRREFLGSEPPGREPSNSVTETFDTLRELLEVAADKLHGIGPRAPDTVTLEMSVELATGGVVRLLGASAKGGLKVSLGWTGGGSAGGARKGDAGAG